MLCSEESSLHAIEVRQHLGDFAPLPTNLLDTRLGDGKAVQGRSGVDVQASTQTSTSLRERTPLPVCFGDPSLVSLHIATLPQGTCH